MFTGSHKATVAPVVQVEEHFLAKYSFFDLSWLKTMLFILLEVRSCWVSEMLLKLGIHLKPWCASYSYSTFNPRLYMKLRYWQAKKNAAFQIWLGLFARFYGAVKGFVRSDTCVALQMGCNQK